MALSGRSNLARCWTLRPFVLVLGAAALAFAAVACERDGHVGAQRPAEPPVEFETGLVRIEAAADTMDLRVEIAEHSTQRAYGLMDRDHLPEDQGMLFVYADAQPSSAGFWMFRTRIPLDIAFLDSAGTILSILHMSPCESPNPTLCRIYSPGVQYWRALEVNRGFFDRHGIGVGDRVVLVVDGAPSDPAP
jgi:uncharacterized protein